MSEGRTPAAASLRTASTFVPGRLGPQDPRDVGGPGVLDVRRGGLEHEGLVLGGSSPEPDLKAKPVVPAGLGQTHVSGLEEDG